MTNDDQHEFVASVVTNPRTVSIKAASMDEAREAIEANLADGEIITMMTDKTECRGGGEQVGD